MIINIPTSSEFKQSATELLNTAWTQVVDLIIEFEGLIDLVKGDEIAPELTPDGLNIIRVPQATEVINENSLQYWKASKQTLSIALTLIQQAVEFYIKGRIVEISPYLLISSSISSGGKSNTLKDKPFSEFKSIDAQDLIKVHNTVTSERLDDSFISWYNEMRDIRNKLMHSVPKDIDLEAEEVLEKILCAHKYFSSSSWTKDRKAFLSNTPAYSMEYFKREGNIAPYILNQLYKELEVVLNSLKPSIISEYFNFRVKDRALLCPKCIETINSLDFPPDNYDEYLKSFQGSTIDNNFNCFICDYTETINFKDTNCNCCEKFYIEEKTSICLNCWCEEADS